MGYEIMSGPTVSLTKESLSLRSQFGFFTIAALLMVVRGLDFY